MAKAFTPGLTVSARVTYRARRILPIAGEVRVSVGDAVEAGTVVGQVGDAPDGRGGLYLEVRIDGRPVNPLEWLSRAQ